VAISVSQLTTDDFVRIFDLPPGKVRTVYFGPARHFHRVDDAPALAAVRHKYQLPERFIFTLSRVGGNSERKNIRGVLDAFARLHGEFPHKLVVGGKDCVRFRDEYSIPSDGWGRDVIFPGWLDQADLPAIYSASDVYLYPSNQEAFPIPLTEAMATGTPIVTSRVNGLEEIAGPAALLVDPRNPDEIAGPCVGSSAIRRCAPVSWPPAWSGRRPSRGRPARGERVPSSRRSRVVPVRPRSRGPGCVTVPGMTTFSGRLVVVAPHMDDESLGCGLLLATHADKSQAHVVFVTDGAQSPEGATADGGGSA
jgi:hypothetical protein